MRWQWRSGGAFMEAYSTLIVEDRPETMWRLHKAVTAASGLFVAGTANTLHEGIDVFDRLKPRVVLVDIGLPDGSGIDLVAHVAKADWPADAMVISIFGDEDRVLNAIRAGASGYILKGSDLDQVGADIMAMIDGGSPISPAIARHVLNQLAAAETDDAPESATRLTLREAEILRAVALGYKRREIGERLGISEGTVGNHITRIYRKLNVTSNTKAVAEALRTGMI